MARNSVESTCRAGPSNNLCLIAFSATAMQCASFGSRLLGLPLYRVPANHMDPPAYSYLLNVACHPALLSLSSSVMKIARLFIILIIMYDAVRSRPSGTHPDSVYPTLNWFLRADFASDL